jgi:hypothetical protein
MHKNTTQLQSSERNFHRRIPRGRGGGGIIIFGNNIHTVEEIQDLSRKCFRKFQLILSAFVGQLFHYSNHVFKFILWWGGCTKYLHIIEYRTVSSVFQTIDPPPPLHPASVSSPRTKGGRVHTRWAVRGWGGQYFGRRKTLDWPLTV